MAGPKLSKVSDGGKGRCISDRQGEKKHLRPLPGTVLLVPLKPVNYRNETTRDGSLVSLEPER